MRWTIREVAERGESDDRIAVIERDAGLIVAVTDGAGGMGGAGRAATVAIEALRTTTPSARPGALCAMLLGVDRLVLRDPTAGETTAPIASITRDAITGASCGDSSIWMITSSGSVDLTAGQGRKRIGGGLAEPVGFARAVASDVRILIGSDGLFDYVRPADLLAASFDADLECAADRLVDLARTPAGTLADDLALVLVEVA